MPDHQDPMLIVAIPSLSLDALVRLPQPPIKAELFGSSPVLSFTSLIEELQVAVAEQELLVEESALPESFLLASNKAEATSILFKLKLKSNPLSLSLSVPRPATHSLRACPRPSTSFSHLSKALLRLRCDKLCGYKGLSHTFKFLLLFLGASQSLEPAAALPPARLLLRSSCWGEAAQAVLR